MIHWRKGQRGRGGHKLSVEEVTDLICKRVIRDEVCSQGICVPGQSGYFSDLKVIIKNTISLRAVPFSRYLEVN